MHTHFSLANLLHPVRALEGRIGQHGPSMQRIASVLGDLRRDGRHAIRILDLECSDGERLISAAASARELGFVAVEGIGVDQSVSRIRQARRDARNQADPSITLDFQVAEAMAALAVEQDGAVDLVLLSGARPYPSSPLAIALMRVSLGPVLGAS